MTMRAYLTLPIFFVAVAVHAVAASAAEPMRQTQVSIEGDQFLINGRLTYEGVTWSPDGDEREYRIEGLLLNARLVQGIFDDLNPETVHRWRYPDTGQWDPDRNTQDFIDAMASWYEHGMRCFVINLQGGSPEGYSRQQPWHNSALRSDGSLREDFMNRLERILDRADQLGMVPMLGIYYFGQDQRLQDEAAVIRGVENTVKWVLDKGYRNVLIEINNECNVAAYVHNILKPVRVHELIELAREITRDGRRLYVGTSYGGGTVPRENVVKVSDFILLHGNGVRDPERMEEMILAVRAMDVYRGQPIVNNEDDQPWRVASQGFGHTGNNFVICVKNYASWGYFDFRLNDELGDFNQGFQTVPANWQISSQRKRAFFGLMAEITSSPGTPRLDLVVSESGLIRAGEEIELQVQIENQRDEASIERIELLVNNAVVAEAKQAPYTFRLKGLPVGEPMARARATYHREGREVIVESPFRTLRVLEEPGRVFVPDQPGMIVLRASDYYGLSEGTRHKWVKTDRAGASGPVMHALPALQQILGADRASPRMDYHVQFDEPGTYYVWVRGLADSGDEDSVHLGLNGVAPPTAQHVHPFDPFKQWVWTNTNRDGARVVLEVNRPGVHTLNVWMREDGFLLDHLLLTRDSAYKPEGEGPELTPQRQAR
jgi:hypothetical protein